MNRERGRADALRANIWKLNLIQACRWFLLLMPVLVLFYQENGLSLHDVFRVQAFYSVCVIVFEVPSGYLADRLGRRRSMLAGVLCAAAGFWVYALSTALPHFLAAQFCIALGASLISGSDAALLYDTLNLVNFGAVDKRKCIEEERRKIKERLFQRQNKKESK